MPTATYNVDGATSYNSTTDIFSVSGTPISIDSSVSPFGFFFSGDIDINIEVDDSGSLVGGVAGNDFELVGVVDLNGDFVPDESGTLLTGEILEFGHQDSGGTTDNFDFRIQITGGLLTTGVLAADYLGKDLGLTTTGENSTFAGDFSVDFGGNAKGNLGTIEELLAPAVIDIEKFTRPDQVVPDPSGIDLCDELGKPAQLEFEYTGGNADAANTSQPAGKFSVTDFNGGPNGAAAVSIVATTESDPSMADGTNTFFSGLVNLNDSLLLDVDNATGRTDFKSKTYIHISDATGTTLLQTINFHTSCSAPIVLGDVVGGATLIGFTSKTGETAQLPDPTIDDFGEDADVGPGPAIKVGNKAIFTYVVTTAGNEQLSDIVVVDDAGTPGILSDDFNPTFIGGDTDNDGNLDPGETWIYEGMKIVTENEHENKATVTGENSVGTQASDMDLSHHTGFLDASITGQVYHDQDNSGDMQVSEPGIGNVDIMLLDDQGEVVASTTTAVDGSYAFTGLVPGVYTVMENDNFVTIEADGHKDEADGHKDEADGHKDASKRFGDAQVLGMTYTGGGDTGSSHSQDEKKVNVAGNDVSASDVFIIATDKLNFNDSKALVFFEGNVGLGATFFIDATVGGKDKLKSKTFVHIFADGADPQVDSPLQSIEFHTSGSQPLFLGNQFGAVQLVSFLGKTGSVSISGFADGEETAGSGGVSETTNPLDVNDKIEVEVGSGDVSSGNKFGEITGAAILGTVFADLNNDGLIDIDEPGINAIDVTLTGIDDRGDAISRTLTTNMDGGYAFGNLRPGTYAIDEAQSLLYDDGIDSLGMVVAGSGGLVSDGFVDGNDRFAGITLDVGAVGDDYDFGEINFKGVQENTTATINFWKGKKGQKLIKQLNGDKNATDLSTWLATNFSNLYGANADQHDVTGLTNDKIAKFYKKIHKDKSLRIDEAGKKRIDPHVLAIALSAYVTNETLAGGTYAQSFGFATTLNGGLGDALVDIDASLGTVGASVTLFGVSTPSVLSVLEILTKSDESAFNGTLFDNDDNGDIDASEELIRKLALDLYASILAAGKI